MNSLYEEYRSTCVGFDNLIDYLNICENSIYGAWRVRMFQNMTNDKIILLNNIKCLSI